MAKGNNIAIWIILLLLVIVVGGGGYFIFTNQAQQSAFGQGGSCDTNSDCGEGYTCVSGICQVTATTDLGQAGVNLYTYDYVASSTTQSDVPYYKWQKNTPSIVTSGTTSSTTYTSLTGITEKTKYIIQATNDTYIGFPVEVEVSGETTLDVKIDVYKRADYGQIKLVKSGDEYDGSSSKKEFNLTIANGASGTDSIDYIEYKQNHTDRATLFAGFYWDMATADANVTISSVSSSGSLSRSSSSSPLTPNILSTGSVGVSLDKNYGQERHKATSKDDYYIFINSQDPITESAEVNGYRPVLLFENDYVRTGSVSFEADSSGCPSTPDSESMTVYGFDVGFYQSVQPLTKDQIVAGYENDASTPVNVGATDVTGPTLQCSTVG